MSPLSSQPSFNFSITSRSVQVSIVMAQSPGGAIFTTVFNGSEVNFNIYATVGLVRQIRKTAFEGSRGVIQA